MRMYCKLSPNDRHDFDIVTGTMDFSNDTKWSESFVGKHWKLVLIVIVGLLIAQKMGLF